MAPPTSPLRPPRERRWLRPLLWGLLLSALLGVAGAALFQQLRRERDLALAERLAALPALGEVPAFTFTNRDGHIVGRGDLAGAPWIADFVFTRCMSSCPLLSARMARLDRLLREQHRLHLVSFSVDPRFDTPAVLERYARSHAASPRWLFLTGDPAAMRRLSLQGFKLALQGQPGMPAPDGTPGGTRPPEAILHSTRFILVDGRGVIRGYYDALSPSALQQLAGDARALAAE